MSYSWSKHFHELIILLTYGACVSIAAVIAFANFIEAKYLLGLSCSSLEQYVRYVVWRATVKLSII